MNLKSMRANKFTPQGFFNRPSSLAFDPHWPGFIPSMPARISPHLATAGGQRRVAGFHAGRPGWRTEPPAATRTRKRPDRDLMRAGPAGEPNLSQPPGPESPKPGFHTDRPGGRTEPPAATRTRNARAGFHAGGPGGGTELSRFRQPVGARACRGGRQSELDDHGGGDAL